MGTEVEKAALAHCGYRFYLSSIRVASNDPLVVHNVSRSRTAARKKKVEKVCKEVCENRNPPSASLSRIRGQHKNIQNQARTKESLKKPSDVTSDRANSLILLFPVFLSCLYRSWRVLERVVSRLLLSFLHLHFHITPLQQPSFKNMPRTCPYCHKTRSRRGLQRSRTATRRLKA